MRKTSLYDYQLAMKKRIVSAFGCHRSVMVQMPTGTGKTHLLASIVADYLAEHQGNRVWIIAHRRELVEQINDTIRMWVDDNDHDMIKAMSIQWLSRHYEDVKGEKPGLIVIDEAHHTLASTYQELWVRFPKAKFLGLTATPCRLNHKGFTDLFDTLVTSHSIPEFIQMGRLSLFDYVSIKDGSKEQALIGMLTKRGADGDYQVKQMNEVLNNKPSIERLYQSMKKYAKDKKGIVYAINIDHARKIAEFYQKHGIEAIAIDSKTPTSVRKELLERFKLSNKKDETLKGIQVLVNVDVFSEGFDCPDVEFIQLARPTLSLAKYLQMVGRGLRISKNKSYCVIIDNVGLYRMFGLPTVPWDWQMMFRGGRKCDNLAKATMAMVGMRPIIY